MKFDRAGYIAIEGPIGVGKTSLALLLAQYLDWRLILENIEDNPFLEGFYRDINRYGQQAELSQYNLFNRVTITDYIFDRNRIFAYINLNSTEIKLYEEIFSILRDRIFAPDLLIYLQADVDTLKDMIMKRRRCFEKGISEEYLDDVNKAFNSYFFNYTQSA